jgi:hypothetical protein
MGQLPADIASLGGRQTDDGMAILFSGSDSEPSERPGTKTRRSDQLDYTLGGFIPF